jgi:SAM-dependent MidA family methyltransferase
MEAALYDSERGYYCRRDLIRWGRQGDYRTSPERSVLFGSTFACYFSRLFGERDSAVTVVEAGPGAGDFAASVLETLEQRSPALFSKLTYVLDDLSEQAREGWSEKLSRFQTHVEYGKLSDLQELDWAIVFANELLDAFPVHRVTVHEGKLVELYVGIDEQSAFTWTRGPISDRRLLEYLDRFQIAPVEAQILEINLAMSDWIRMAGQKLKRGFLIVVDYGAEQRTLFHPSRTDGTLRSFRRHELTPDVLNSPGTQDITSSVDWIAVMEFSKDSGFETITFERQDRFLLENGLLEELEVRTALAKSEAEALQLRTSARDMILPGGMAQSFQVLVLRRL